jgi:hypothetical protein
LEHVEKARQRRASFSKWSASEKLRGKVLQKSRGVAAQENGRRCTDRDISKLVPIFTSDLVTVTLEPSLTTDILLLL